METLLSILVGIGLSAACGFRVFIPPLIISIAASSGHLKLAGEFAWMAGTPALIAFSIAAGLEIAAYYVPWLDNLLDTAATPAAIVAGSIVSASMVGDVSPFLKWTLAIIAGGGAAAAVQGVTVVARGASTTLTGGLANWVVATGEWLAAIVTAILAVLLPILALLLLVVSGALILWWALRKKTVKPAAV